MLLKHILLAEDNQYDVELTLAAFKKNGVTRPIAVVRDGAETLDYLYCRCKYDGRSSGCPAVILLDLKMPKVGGLDVLRLIRADPNLKFIPPPNEGAAQSTLVGLISRSLSNTIIPPPTNMKGCTWYLDDNILNLKLISAEEKLLLKYSLLRL